MHPVRWGRGVRSGGILEKEGRHGRLAGLTPTKVLRGAGRQSGAIETGMSFRAGIG